MKNIIFSVVLVLTFVLAGNSFGQILCVKNKTANLRSSPSLTGSIVILQVPRHYPLDIQGENGDFLYVRDFQGRDGWVAKSVVHPEAGIIVNVRIVNVRSGPGKDHEVLFKARRGVTFRVLQNQLNWLYVEHETGKKGWIYKDLVWGLKSKA